MKYKKNVSIICEVEASKCAYIIDFVTAEVFKSLPNGEQKFLGIMAQGDIFGELGLINGLPRSAAVVALKDCAVSVMTQVFLDLSDRRNSQFLVKAYIAILFLKI